MMHSLYLRGRYTTYCSNYACAVVGVSGAYDRPVWHCSKVIEKATKKVGMCLRLHSQSRGVIIAYPAVLSGTTPGRHPLTIAGPSLNLAGVPVMA